ncbi:MAG: hypothetical protein COA80_19130, partial [Leeuwenhoekiella sp.]
ELLVEPFQHMLDILGLDDATRGPARFGRGLVLHSLADDGRVGLHEHEHGMSAYPDFGLNEH